MAVRPGKRKGPPFWAGREGGSGSSGALNRILSGQISRGSPPVGAYLPHLARFPGDRRPGPPAGSKPERAPQRPEDPARQGPALRRELHCGRQLGVDQDAGTWDWNSSGWTSLKAHHGGGASGRSSFG